MMTLSIFDLFKIDIGPSFYHAVGPMKAAAMFSNTLAQEGHLIKVERVEVSLYGSVSSRWLNGQASCC